MTDPQRDLTEEMINVAARAQRAAEAQEEAEATLLELGDLADKTALYFNNLVKRGIPPRVAQECVATMSDNYWFFRFQMQFRGVRE